MKNILREVIEKALNDVAIEIGGRDYFTRVADSVELAVSKKILSHDIDYYTEDLKRISPANHSNKHK